MACIVAPTISPHGARMNEKRQTLHVVALIALGTLATAVYRTIWIANRLSDRGEN